MTKDEMDVPQVSPDFRYMRTPRATNRAPQHQPATESVVTACTWCGRKFRKSDLAHVGNGAYKCRECLLGGKK